MSATVLNPDNQHDTTAAITFSPSGVAATTVGNAFIIGIACATKTRTISSVSATGNSGWAQLAGAGSSSAGSAFLWWLPSISTSFTTFTVTANGTSKMQVGMLEVSGLDGTLTGTASATNLTTAATTQSDSITTTASDSFVVAIIGSSTAPSAIGSPFSIVSSASAGGSGLQLYMATAEAGATTYNANWTTASEVSTVAIGGFGVTTGGGGVTVKQFATLGVG